MIGASLKSLSPTLSQREREFKAASDKLKFVGHFIEPLLESAQRTMVFPTDSEADDRKDAAAETGSKGVPSAMLTYCYANAKQHQRGQHRLGRV